MFFGIFMRKKFITSNICLKICLYLCNLYFFCSLPALGSFFCFFFLLSQTAQGLGPSSSCNSAAFCPSPLLSWGMMWQHIKIWFDFPYYFELIFWGLCLKAACEIFSLFVCSCIDTIFLLTCYADFFGCFFRLSVFIYGCLWSNTASSCGWHICQTCGGHLVDIWRVSSTLACRELRNSVIRL